jgi:hypothetical protein
MLGALLPDHRRRHVGLGEPLTRESWLYRPFSVGWHVGMIQGSELITDWIGMKTGYFAGYRAGWDSGYYWGAELHLSFGSIELYDSGRAIAQQRQTDIDNGYAPNDPWVNRFDARRDLDLIQFDLRAMYYPWGDAAWRPYFALGLGVSELRFMDRMSQHYREHFVLLPIALGVKYRYNDWLALRLELADNLSISTGRVKSTNNISLTAGFEVRFGGTRTAYWPWNPGRHYW